MKKRLFLGVVLVCAFATDSVETCSFADKRVQKKETILPKKIDIFGLQYILFDGGKPRFSGVKKQNTEQKLSLRLIALQWAPSCSNFYTQFQAEQLPRRLVRSWFNQSPLEIAKGTRLARVWNFSQENPIKRAWEIHFHEEIKSLRDHTKKLLNQTSHQKTA